MKKNPLQIVYTVNSPISTMLTIALNEVMIAKIILNAKSNTLLLQKNIDLDKLINIKTQQEEIRDIARKYLDNYSPKILSFLTDITGFYNVFTSYFETIDDYISKLNSNDENEQKGYLSDINEMLDDILNFIKEKKDKVYYLSENLINNNKKVDTLNKRLIETKKIAEEYYIGDKVAINSLELRIQKLLEEIKESNYKIANGALDSTKNILKIATTLVTNYIQDKNLDETKETKDIIESKSVISIGQPIPIVINNLKLFNNNKEIPTTYGSEIKNNIKLYRECVEQLQKYNNESTIALVLIQQWEAFIHSMSLITENIEYLAKAWQEQEQNFIRFKNKFLNNKSIDESIIKYVKEQWSLSNSDLSQLNDKAKSFERLSYLEVIVDQDKDKDRNFSSYDFRKFLNVPNLHSARLTEKIIIKHSEE